MLPRLLRHHPRTTLFTSTLLASTALFIKQSPFKALNTYSTVSSTMKITPIPMFSDNYAYLVTDPGSKESAIVDPAEPKSVLPVLKKMVDSGEINLTSIITTHHHGDHAGGNKEILQNFPKLTVYGGKDCAMTNHFVKDHESFNIGGIKVTGLHTPCHTQDSVCYFLEQDSAKAVFTGDTLFIAGCGRFFEGSAEEMDKALNKILGSLPADTKVYPGHEYTLSNAKFGQSVSSSDALKELVKECQSNDVTTGRFTIADEKKWNVFMRLDDPEITKATGQTDPIKVMAKLREMKNNFREARL